MAELKKEELERCLIFTLYSDVIPFCPNYFKPRNLKGLCVYLSDLKNKSNLDTVTFGNLILTSAADFHFYF